MQTIGRWQRAHHFLATLKFHLTVFPRFCVFSGCQKSIPSANCRTTWKKRCEMCRASILGCEKAGLLLKARIFFRCHLPWKNLFTVQHLILKRSEVCMLSTSNPQPHLGIWTWMFSGTMRPFFEFREGSCQTCSCPWDSVLATQFKATA